MPEREEGLDRGIVSDRPQSKTVLEENEQALRESEARFHELADNISQFAWTADRTGWIYWYNKRWLDYTGTTLEEMEGWGWQKVHHPDHVDRVVRRIQQSFETGEPWEDTFPLRGRDGKYRWFLSRALPIRDEAGNIIRWFGTNTDITEQIEAEQALRELNETLEQRVEAETRERLLIEAEKFAVLGRMVAGVAHEVNTPVGTSLTLATTLQRKAQGFAGEVMPGNLRRSSLNEFLAAINDACAQLIINLGRAAERIQSFKQVAVDQNKAHRRTFDAGELAEQILSNITEDLRERAIVLNFHRAPDLTMDSFPGQLGEVLTHITLNCITHAFPDSETGTIDIKLLGTHPDHVEIVIADDGCGMTPEVKRRAFDPFFTTGRHRGARGLGLHTVYNIVAERLGGHVKLDSESGTGTTVQLILPRSAPRAD